MLAMRLRLFCLFWALWGGLFSSTATAKQHTVIVGGGIIGFFEAYFTYKAHHKEGLKNASDCKITIIEKNNRLSDTTASNIAPSLTPDEITAIIPPGKSLIKGLKSHFSVRKGLRVDDVPGINNSLLVMKFLKSVRKSGKDKRGHQERNGTLLELGRLSMDLWQTIYHEADDDFRKILDESCYLSCKETCSSDLHDGYRMDLIVDCLDAAVKAKQMTDHYFQLGYAQTRVLTPAEVLTKDPSLYNFVIKKSDIIGDKRFWKDGNLVIWRPGGCINTTLLLPGLKRYLETKLAHNFKVLFGKKVTSVGLNSAKDHISHLVLSSQEGHREIFPDNPQEVKEYIFAPGEAVGTLRALGFKEPHYAIFAGPTLKLEVPASSRLAAKYANLFHCMEIHQDDVVLAWRAQYLRNKGVVSVATGGTKAFYGGVTPKKSELFARNRAVLQLNIINSIFPDLVSAVLRRNTTGHRLSVRDLKILVDNNHAVRWVGSRAVAYDGFPTLGPLQNSDSPQLIRNGRTTTHLGSGGVSFAPAVVAMSRRIAFLEFSKMDILTRKVQEFSRVDR